MIAGSNFSVATDVAGNLSSSGIIRVAGTGTVGTLRLSDSLTLNDGGTVHFDLADNTTPGSGINDLVEVTGSLTLNGTTTISVTPVNGLLAAGNYTLFTYGGSFAGAASNLVLTGVATGGRRTYAFDTGTVGSVFLSVIGSPADLIWVGNGTTNPWDLTTTDWNNGGSADKFFDQDNVTFNDTGSASPDVAITTTLLPGSVTVNSDTKDYAFTGAGAIAGTAGLTKEGTRTLTITNTNSFTGAVAIKNGTVSVATVANTGVNSPLGAGTGLPADISLGDGANTGKLQYTGATGATNRPLSIDAGGGEIEVTNPAATLTISTGIAGFGNLAKSGGGTLLLGGAGTYFGITSVNAGVLKIGNATALGTNPAVTIASGATLDVNGLGAGAMRYDLTVGGNGVAGQAAIWNSGAAIVNNPIYQSITLTGDTTIGTNTRYDVNLNGNGGVTFNGGTFTLTKVGTGETWWSPDFGATVGDIVVNAGTFGVQSSLNLGDTSYSLIINPGATVGTYGGQTNDKPIVINGGTLASTNGLNTYSGPITLSGTADQNRIAPAIGIQLDLTGDIAGTGLTKIDDGTVTLSGTQSYASLTNTAGRTVLDATLANATITGDGGSLVLNADATNSTVNVNDTNTTYFTASQTLAALNIADGGTVILTDILDVPPPAPAPELAPLFDAGLGANEAAVAAVPEPGAIGLLLLGAAGMLGRRRRRAV